MTIWLLTLLLLAGFGYAGHAQGAIRGGITFLGIFLAAMLAVLVGKIFGPILGIFGVKNPIWLWIMPPFLGFLLIMILIHVGAHFVHQKVDVYYKYKAGDLRLALWERLNARVGICLGLLNGVAYLVLLAFVIHAFSYWTVQLSSSEEDPKSVRLLNKLGRDLESTKMNRVAKAIDPFDKTFYDTADLAGLLFQNSLLEARFLRYPGFLSLGERQEFQALGSDNGFAEMRLRGTPIREVLEQPSAKAIFENPDLLREIWATVKPDLGDLRNFLETGKSAKYDGEKLLGRWHFNPSGSLLAYRRTRNVSRQEAAQIRAWLEERFGKAIIVAAPDKNVYLRNFAELKMQVAQPGSSEVRNLKGTWKADGLEDYVFELEGGTIVQPAKFEGRHLILPGDGITIAFVKED